jgi:hypothetical protein
VLRQIVVELKPDAIVHELPLSQWDVASGRPLQREYPASDTGPGCPENWAGDQAAQLLHIRQIPFDRPDRQEHFKATMYFERERTAFGALDARREELRSGKIDKPAAAILSEFFSQILEAEVKLDKCSPREINCQAYDQVIRTKSDIRQALVEEVLADADSTALQDMRFFDRDWQERNEIMASNILRAASQHPGGRLVVLTGAAHRYILRDLLISHADVRLREYWEVADFDSAKAR